jgi:hypothetical protein
VDLLLQTTGSLVAILALAGLAWWMKLGGAPTLASTADVERIAGEIVDGFAPVAESRDRSGSAALARNAAGRIMLIKRHGNRFAGRVLGPGAAARIESGALEVDCGEARFGKVVLALAEPEAWAAAINRLHEHRHA